MLFKNLKKIILDKFEHYQWKKNNFMYGTPQKIKENIFKMYAIKNAQWVETGTYLGTTTEFLSKNYNFVYSIEPNYKLYQNACLKFKKNVTLYNDTSENVFPKLLPLLSGNINFWLDGHYSGEDTYKGQKETPIESELNCIKENISRLDNVVIFIDDLRLFYNNSQNSYPTVNYLVNFTKKLDMKWKIVHDIFIMYKY